MSGKYLKYMTNGKRVFRLHSTKGWKLCGLLKTYPRKDQKKLLENKGKAIKL